jgi:hypothetical protein
MAAALLLSALAFAGCDDTDPNAPGASTRHTATLTGGAVHPAPVTTAATGSATLNVTREYMSYSVSVTGLTGVTEVHLHQGAPGSNGLLVAKLLVNTTPSGNVSGVITSGTMTGPDLVDTQLTMSQVADLLRTGGAYVDIHTSPHPGGELRGQLSQ